jgi:crossover junction endodeoxyribonuclease RusA
MTVHRFTVPGDPVPWERSKTNGRRHFTAPRTAAHQNRIRFHAKRHFRRPLAGPVTLVVVAYRASARRCDWDNIGKTVSDALNGIAFEDDSQVVLGTVHKLIDRERPRTEVEVREAPEVAPVSWEEAVEQADREDADAVRSGEREIPT